MHANWQDPPEYRGRMQSHMPAMTPVVKTLILANAIVFGITFLLSFDGGASWGFVQRTFALAPQTWRDWFPFLPLWQLASYGFLHALDNPFHIVGNMLFLYFLGTLLESIIGPRRFFATYAGALLVAGLAMLSVGILTGDPRPTIGASGAVLAVVVATAVLRPDTRVIFILFPITLKTLAIIDVGFDLFNALLTLKGADSGVAHLAHLAGAGYGYLFARRGWIWKDPGEGLAQWRDARLAEQDVADAERLDELLAKISRDGIQSLNAREKAFLKRKSKRG